jgi:hypothetical protein
LKRAWKIKNWKNYASELQERGIQQIRKLAIVFEGKRVWVKEQNAEG